MRGADFLEAKYERGHRNLITDVSGVLVSNITFKGKNLNTGLTVVSPHDGNVYEKRVFASFFVLNGYGKSTGIVQVAELGILETPISITGTLNVGIVFDDVVDYYVEKYGVKSINPVVLECNDSRLSDPSKRYVLKGAFRKAMDSLRRDFEVGSVGAGTGMVAFGYKSGIGSSSRKVGDFTLGVLAVPNLGKREELSIGMGSIIVVLATDAPLIPRQLRRIAVRSSIGVARIGGRAHHTSGDIFFAFSVATKIPRDSTFVKMDYLNDDSEIFKKLMDATIEATEEAIVDALVNAESVEGLDGKVYEKISIEDLKKRG